MNEKAVHDPAERVRLPEASREEIKIPGFTLRDRIQIQGTDIWGRDATMSLEPTEKQGWYLRVQDEGKERDVLITPDMLHTEHHHLYLAYKGRRYARVCEHLLPLKFAGIDGVCIVPKQNSEWLPYDGSGLIFWKAVESNLRPSDPLRSTSEDITVAVQKAEKDGFHRSASLKTESASSQLDATALVDFHQFGGQASMSRSLPESIGDMYDLFAAKPLGKPAWLEPVLRLAAQFGWPHVEKIVWPKAKREKEGFEIQKEVLLQIALHRYFDMLGAMAVVSKPGEVLTGKLTSEKGNHALDVALIRAMTALRTERKERPTTEEKSAVPEAKVSYALAQKVAPILKLGPAHWGEASRAILSALNINPTYLNEQKAGFTEMRNRINTPGTPVIMVANHPSPLDVSLLCLILTRPDMLIVVQKKNQVRWEGFLGKGNVIGVSSAKDDIAAMREAVSLQLSKGGAVIYFPTGGLDAESGEVSFRSGFRQIIEDAPAETLVHAVYIDPSAGNRISTETLGPPKSIEEKPELLAPAMHVRRVTVPIDVALNETTTKVTDWRHLLSDSDDISLNKKLTDFYLDLVRT